MSPDCDCVFYDGLLVPGWGDPPPGTDPQALRLPTNIVNFRPRNTRPSALAGEDQDPEMVAA